MDSRCTCSYQTISSFGPLTIEVDYPNQLIYVEHETEDFYSRYFDALYGGELNSTGHEDFSQAKFYTLSEAEKAWLELNLPAVRKAVYRINHGDGE